jgi:hypothetical protein
MNNKKNLVVNVSKKRTVGDVTEEVILSIKCPNGISIDSIEEAVNLINMERSDALQLSKIQSFIETYHQDKIMVGGLADTVISIIERNVLTDKEMYIQKNENKQEKEYKQEKE